MILASQKLGFIQFGIRYNSTLSKTVSPALLVLQVGLIKECNKHPDADKLYVSKIVTSESEDATPFTVCSGLVNYIPREDLLNKKVVLLTNLKPSKMRGIKSEAMILASENSEATKVEVVSPPISSELGELLQFKPFVPEKAPPRLKSKVWEEIQTSLFTDSEGRVIFKSDDQEYKLSGSKGDFAFVETLKNAIVR